MTDKPTVGHPRQAEELHDRRAPAAGRGQVRRVRLRRQHRARRWPRRWSSSSCTTGSSGPPSSRSFPRRGNPSSCSTPAPTSTARAEELVQFARLGAVYAEDMLGRDESGGRAAQHRRRAGEGQRRREGSAPAARRTPGLNFHGQRRRTRPPDRRSRSRAGRRRRLRRLRRQRGAQVLRGRRADHDRTARQGAASTKSSIDGRPASSSTTPSTAARRCSA